MIQLFVAPLQQGTISITAGSFAAVGTGTAFTSADIDKQITIRTTGGDKRFVISGVTNSTLISLSYKPSISQSDCFYTTDQFEIDLYDNFPYSLNYNIADIREPDKRNADFSKTINIPGSDANNQVFGHIFEIDVDSSFNPNLRTDVIITEDNVQVFKGNLQLLQINRNGDTLEYEVAVFGKVGDLFHALGDKLLTDLDLSAYNHVSKPTEIVSSWSKAVGDGYVYPLINNGLWEPKNELSSFDSNIPTMRWDNMSPAVYVKTLVDAIFKSAGFAYSSNFFNDSSSTLFKRLITPCKWQRRQVTINWNIAIKAYNQLGSNLSTGAETMAIAIMVRNTNTGETSVQQIITFSFASRADQTTIVQAGSKLITIQPGDNVYSFYLRPFNANVNMAILTESYIEFVYNINGKQTDGSFKAVCISPINTPKGSAVVVFTDDSVNGYDTGNTYNNVTGYHVVPHSNFQAQLPDNIKQADFLMDIIRMFNLYVVPDKFDTNTLYIEPREDFYHAGSIVDWSNKLDVSKEIDIKPIAELDSLYYYFHYKSDNDFYNTDYGKRFQNLLQKPATYGERIINIENDFLTETKEIALGFSPTPSAGSTVDSTGKLNNDLVLPSILKDNTQAVPNNYDGGNIRILYYGGLKQTVTGWYMLPDAGARKFVYPYAGHLDDPQNPQIIDLLFGIPAQVYWQMNDPSKYQNKVNGAAFPNLFNKYYSNFISEIINKDAKVVTMYMRLRPVDIYSLDFRNAFFINGSYYHLNKITDYNPESEDTVQCEFVKLNFAINAELTLPNLPVIDKYQQPGNGGLKLTLNGGGWITSNGIGGDVQIQPDGKVKIIGIQGIPISGAVPANGAQLVYDEMLKRLTWNETAISGAFLKSAFSNGFN